MPSSKTATGRTQGQSFNMARKESSAGPDGSVPELPVRIDRRRTGGSKSRDHGGLQHRPER